VRACPGYTPASWPTRNVPGGSTVLIERLSFLGVRTDDFVDMTAFARDVQGLKPGHEDYAWAAFQLKSRDPDRTEVSRRGRHDERALPAVVTQPTVEFAADDLLAARDELETAEIEIAADIVRAAEAFGDPGFEYIGWLSFRAPDETVYTLQQVHGPTDRVDD
jgi:hypothetical protein